MDHEKANAVGVVFANAAVILFSHAVTASFGLTAGMVTLTGYAFLLALSFQNESDNL